MEFLNAHITKTENLQKCEAIITSFKHNQNLLVEKAIPEMTAFITEYLSGELLNKWGIFEFDELLWPRNPETALLENKISLMNDYVNTHRFDDPDLVYGNDITEMYSKFYCFSELYGIGWVNPGGLDLSFEESYFILDNSPTLFHLMDSEQNFFDTEPLSLAHGWGFPVYRFSGAECNIILNEFCPKLTAETSSPNINAFRSLVKLASLPEFSLLIIRFEG